MSDKPPHIGTLREKSLHAALKQWYAQPGDSFEVRVGKFVVDILRGETLIEIQTSNFGVMKPKLTRLLEQRSLRLLHPIASEKFVVRVSADGVEVSRRKSPKKGQVAHVFSELVYIPQLMLHPNFALEVLLTREEQILLDDGAGSWRRKGWSVADRRLVEVVERVVFESAQDFALFLPPTLPDSFTTLDLATANKLPRHPRHLAQKMAYCLREMGVIERVGKQGNAFLYSRTEGF